MRWLAEIFAHIGGSSSPVWEETKIEATVAWAEFVAANPHYTRAFVLVLGEDVDESGHMVYEISFLSNLQTVVTNLNILCLRGEDHLAAAYEVHFAPDASGATDEVRQMNLGVAVITASKGISKE